MSPSLSEPKNGVLAKVRGDEIAAASRTLPLPRGGISGPMIVDIDTIMLGWVRLTFEVKTFTRRKSSQTFWSAKHAEQIPSPEDPLNVW